MGMFARPLDNEFVETATLVAVCDTNNHRLELAKAELDCCPSSYNQYEKMLQIAEPDVVIVATPDGTHHTYILGALRAGVDVITEKPMTTTAEWARQILEAEKASGARVRVSFNARYGAPAEMIYRLLRDGAIGEILSADYTEYLNTSHGADYFRRWHRRKEMSGGLLVHKATHHFDQLNWWIDAEPETVFAMGARRFYGPIRQARGQRCLTCPHRESCEFYLDLRADPKLRELYLEGEAIDGYYRDACVFAEEIDIEDTAAVTIRYENGVIVNYGLNAFAPYEGQRIGFNGSKGRLEVDLVDRYHGPDDEGVVRVHPIEIPHVIRVSPLFGKPRDVPYETRDEGGHGGADARIRQHLFGEDVPDPLNQVADARAGALSLLIGVASNQSIATGQAVRIADLLGE
jgi:predicted dehydrogenase